MLVLFEDLLQRIQKFGTRAFCDHSNHSFWSFCSDNRNIYIIKRHNTYFQTKISGHETTELFSIIRLTYCEICTCCCLGKGTSFNKKRCEILLYSFYFSSTLLMGNFNLLMSFLHHTSSFNSISKNEHAKTQLFAFLFDKRKNGKKMYTTIFQERKNWNAFFSFIQPN